MWSSLYHPFNLSVMWFFMWHREWQFWVVHITKKESFKFAFHIREGVGSVSFRIQHGIRQLVSEVFLPPTEEHVKVEFSYLQRMCARRQINLCLGRKKNHPTDTLTPKEKIWCKIRSIKANVGGTSKGRWREGQLEGEGGRAAYATHWLPQGHRSDARNFPVLGEIVMSMMDSYKEAHMANKEDRPKRTAL